MPRLRTLITAAAIGIALGPPAFAQPGPYAQPGPSKDQHQGQRQGRHQGQYQQRPPRGPAQGTRSDGQYYYNGRWVDQSEWQRHSAETLLPVGARSSRPLAKTAERRIVTS